MGVGVPLVEPFNFFIYNLILYGIQYTNYIMVVPSRDISEIVSKLTVSEYQMVSVLNP